MYQKAELFLVNMINSIEKNTDSEDKNSMR